MSPYDYGWIRADCVGRACFSASHAAAQTRQDHIQGFKENARRQMQLASTLTRHSAVNSVTCSYDSGYQRTRKTINSPGCCHPLKGLIGVIGIDFHPTNLLAGKFATEPRAKLVVRSAAGDRHERQPVVIKVGCVAAHAWKHGRRLSRRVAWELQQTESGARRRLI
jgi:hypothetical protein